MQPDFPPPGVFPSGSSPFIFSASAACRNCKNFMMLQIPDILRWYLCIYGAHNLIQLGSQMLHHSYYRHHWHHGGGIKVGFDIIQSKQSQYDKIEISKTFNFYKVLDRNLHNRWESKKLCLLQNTNVVNLFIMSHAFCTSSFIPCVCRYVIGSR